MRTIEIPSGEFVVCVIALIRKFFVDHKQLKKSKLGDFFLYVIFSDSFTVKTVLNTNIRSFCCTKPAITRHFKGFSLLVDFTLSNAR